MVRLANPISSEFGWLRTSLLPNLLEAVRRNAARGFKDVALYEVGAVFLPGESLGSPSNEPVGVQPSAETLAALDAGIPDQPRHVAGAFAGHEAAPGAGFAIATPTVSEPTDTIPSIAPSTAARSQPDRVM